MSFQVDQSGRDVRAAQNQVLFQAFDEHVHDLNRHMDFIVPLDDWVCECTTSVCTERIQMSVHDYEAVRRQTGHFLVAPNDTHFQPDAERVIEHHQHYWVVEATGLGGTPADRDDRQSYSEPLPLHT